MSVILARVVNQQTIPAGLSRNGSLLLDKIDKSQGNSSSPPYAQRFKQKLYVPRLNPLDTSVKGYTDLVQTDEVKLALEPHGSIGALATTVPPRVTVTLFSSILTAAPVITGDVLAGPSTTISGTTFLSILPDLTKLILTTPGGVSATFLQADFTVLNATTITILDATVAAVLGGAPAAGWLAKVFANSKLSNTFVLA